MKSNCAARVKAIAFNRYSNVNKRKPLDTNQESENPQENEESRNPQRRRVVLQMPVFLHNDTEGIVEREIEIHDWYQPGSGEWIFHKATAGLMRLGPVIYDGVENRLVLCCAFPAHDPTCTLEEWLEERPEWKVAEKPFLINKRKPPED